MQAEKLLINGHYLNVETHGAVSGTPVVLLHHGLGYVRAWKAQIAELAEQDYFVIAYDRWGYGGSQARPSLDVPGFDQDISDLTVLLDLLEIQRAALVGHSDGGTIALVFAARYPGRVSCLATIAAHIYVEPKMEAGILAVRNAFDHDQRFQEGMRRAHGEAYKAVFDHWFDGWMKPGNLGWDIRAQLSAIRCPVWVVQGAQDEHASPQHARDIAASIQDSTLWLVPGAGHMLPQELPEDFNQHLLAFLSSSNCQKSFGRMENHVQ